MITVVASADLFWGFKIMLPNEVSQLPFDEQCSSVNAEIKRELIEFFLSKNLQILKEKVDQLHLHLHASLVANELSYACDHKHEHH